MHKTINISISKRLLKAIEENVTGKNRSDKIRKVVTLGYEVLTKQSSELYVLVAEHKDTEKWELSMISLDDLRKFIQNA